MTAGVHDLSAMRVAMRVAMRDFYAEKIGRTLYEQNSAGHRCTRTGSGRPPRSCAHVGFHAPRSVRSAHAAGR